MIYQNDQYFIKIKPTLNGTIVDDSVDEMTIKVGCIVKKKSLNQISYDSDLKRWLFFLTTEETAKLKDFVDVQCCFQIDNNRIDTPVVKVDIGKSILKVSEVVQ